MIEIIKKSIPNAIKYGKLNDAQLQKAITKYEKRIISLSKNSAKQVIPHCFYDWISLAIQNNKKAVGFLSFIDSECVYAISHTNLRFHKNIRTIIESIILTMDTNTSIENNPTYLNFIGELIGLNYILKNGNDKFELVEIEKKLPNKKQADFVFKDKSTNELLYVDFISIHNIDPSKSVNDTELIAFLENRFNVKLGSKTTNLSEDFHKLNLPNNCKVNFAILPIIWTELNTLIPFINTFKSIDEKYANVFRCCSILSQIDEDGIYHYSFCSVYSVLNLWKN